MTRQERMIINLYEANMPGFVANYWKNDELPKLTNKQGINIWIDDKEGKVYLQFENGGTVIGTAGLFNFEAAFNLLASYGE